MSEVAAPAAVETAPVETTEGAAPVVAKPRTIDDDLEDVLKKHGGYSYKAAGKEKKVEKAADLKRLLSSRESVDSALNEALKKTQHAESITAKLTALEKLPRHERLKALEGIGINPKILREAIEDNILEEDSREKSLAQLSPRERQLQQALEERDAELATHRQTREQAEKEQEHEAHAARVNEIGQRLEKVTVGALQKLKIAPAHVPLFMEPIARALDRAERLGLELGEDELAEVVMHEQESIADRFYGGLDVASLADRLETMEVEDPAVPGKKTTRAKLLMQEYAKRIRARQAGPVTTPTRAPIQQAQPSGTSREDKIAAARTFGGGW